VLILEKCDPRFAVWYVYIGAVVYSTANKDYFMVCLPLDKCLKFLSDSEYISVGI